MKRKNWTIGNTRKPRVTYKSSHSRYKYSEAQLRSYAVRSRSITKQSRWMKRLYEQKAKIARRQGNTSQYGLYKELKTKVKSNIKRFGISKYKRDWTIAKSQADIEKMFYSGVVNKAQGKIILVEDDGSKMILYEGSEGYDEIVSAKELQAALEKAGLV